MPRYSPEDAIEILWERGNLDYLMHAGQEKIEEAFQASTGRGFVANCSRRLGKTFWACKKAVEYALNCPLPNPRIKYASATKIELKEFVMPAFELILMDCPEEYRPTWKASESKYIFPHNGAEIQIIGLDKRPDGGRGNYCDLYIFEEAGMINKLEYLYYSVVSPMMITRKGSKIIMISTPSVTPAHPFQIFCERAQSKGDFIELTIYDNPMLEEEQIAEIKRETVEEAGESTWLREYMCQHVVDTNLAIIPEWHEKYEVGRRRPEYFEYLHRYVSMDIGVKRDLTALLYGYWNPKKGELVIEYEDEMNGPQMTTDKLKDMIVRREGEIWGELDDPPYKRIADNNNPLLLQDLGALHGLHFSATSKDELLAMVNELRVLVKAGKIIIHPRCVKTIGCLKYGIFENEKKRKFGHSKIYGHFDHLAALIYLARNIDRYSDPVPDLWDVDRKKRWVIREPSHEREMERAANAICGFDEED